MLLEAVKNVAERLEEFADRHHQNNHNDKNDPFIHASS